MAQSARCNGMPKRNTNALNPSHTWTLPLPGFVKINMDSAFPPQLQSAKLGMCLRKETGNVILVRTIWLPYKMEVCEGEAMGLL